MKICSANTLHIAKLLDKCLTYKVISGSPPGDTDYYLHLFAVTCKVMA